MSHRIYIYNVAKPTQSQQTDVMVSEWGYEVPLLLQALLVDGGFIDDNTYNNHVNFNNQGLYFNTKPGIDHIKKLYLLIENQHHGLVDNLETFLSAKEKLFAYLDKLEEVHFHLDAWDVFNMTNKSHEAQAKQLLLDIKQNNAVFTRALEADDVSLIDFNAFNKNATLGFDSFKALLNYPDYEYGWAHIWQKFEEEADVEIFEIDGLWGLKSEEGNVLFEPFFDEFYGFEQGTTAVVSKAGKFGYINKTGKIIIPLSYDDGFDFEGDCAIVKLDGKFGLVNLDGQIKMAPIYNDIYLISAPNIFYCAKLEEKYGIIDVNSNSILPFEFNNKFEADESGKFFYVRENDSENILVYAHQFLLLGRYDPKLINVIEMEMGETIVYEIKKHQHVAANLLISDNGLVLIDGYQEIIEFYTDVLLIRKNNKFGLYKTDGKSALGFECYKIEDLNVSFDVPVNTFFKEITEENIYKPYRVLKLIVDYKNGLLFHIQGFNSVVFPLIYDDIKYIGDEFFGVKKGHKWAVFDITSKAFSNFIYDELINVISYSAIAYGLKEDMVYIIAKTGVELANKFHLQDYVDANGDYDYYYFTTEIQEKIQFYIDSN